MTSVLWMLAWVIVAMLIAWGWARFHRELR